MKAENKGIELWIDMSKYLNQIVIDEGVIRIDNTTLWDKYFHNKTNQDWLVILSVLERLHKKHPKYFDPGHKSIIDIATDLILSNSNNNIILDTRIIGADNKTKAWRLAMSCREIYNNIFNINLPIQKQTRTFKRTTVWD